MWAVVLKMAFLVIRVPGTLRAYEEKSQDPLSVFPVNPLGGQHPEPGRGAHPPKFTLSFGADKHLGGCREGVLQGRRAHSGSGAVGRGSQHPVFLSA